MPDRDSSDGTRGVKSAAAAAGQKRTVSDQFKELLARGGRVKAVVPRGFELSVESRMQHDWSHNRRLYEAWAIYDHWPAGMLANIAGPTDDGVVIQAIWRDSDAQDEYFGTVGIERFTEAVRLMRTEDDPNPVVADLEPIHRTLTFVSFGPAAEAFIDIGADLAETSALQFGTVPAAIDIRMPDVDLEHADALWRELGFLEEIDVNCVMRMQEVTRLGAVLDTMFWISRETAERFVNEELRPAFESTGLNARGTLEFNFRPVKRIALGAAELSPYSFKFT